MSLGLREKPIILPKGQVCHPLTLYASESVATTDDSRPIECKFGKSGQVNKLLLQKF